jgi:DNA replication and repair protein RecF
VRLERLIVQGFRNLHGDEGADAPLHWQPHPRFNLLVGDNGQGKTNLLEAVAVLAGLRSFRTARLQDCVAFGQQQATLAATVTGRAGRVQLGLQIGPRSRKLLVDHKPVASAAAFLGHLTAVTFSTADLQLPHAEPEQRRRWLDRVVFNHQPAHLDELRRYEQALAARNTLLRQQASGKAAADPGLLDVYDGLLARHGAEVVRRRLEVLGRFEPQVQAVFGRIAAAGLSCAVRYVAKTGPSSTASASSAASEDFLREALRERRSRDLALGYTTRGPHRDDALLQIGDLPAHLHASQGQCRALVLACKIAEIISLEAALGEPPLLLMDDISSELDAQRNAALMAFLHELGGQVVLTTTATAHIRVDAPRQVFAVHAGTVQPGAVVEAAPPSSPPQSALPSPDPAAAGLAGT